MDYDYEYEQEMFEIYGSAITMTVIDNCSCYDSFICRPCLANW